MADAGHHIAGREGRLLDLGEVVGRVAVQLQDADLLQGIVLVRPDLGEVEGVVGRLVGIALRHDLDHHSPLGKVTALDGLKQIALMGFTILADQFCRLGVGHALDALHGLEVELDPVALAGVIEKAVGV